MFQRKSEECQWSGTWHQKMVWRSLTMSAYRYQGFRTALPFYQFSPAEDSIPTETPAKGELSQDYLKGQRTPPRLWTRSWFSHCHQHWSKGRTPGHSGRKPAWSLTAKRSPEHLMKPKPKAPMNRLCFRCGQVGHLACNCMSTATSGVSCFWCDWGDKLPANARTKETEQGVLNPAEQETLPPRLNARTSENIPALSSTTSTSKAMYVQGTVNSHTFQMLDSGASCSLMSKKLALPHDYPEPMPSANWSLQMVDQWHPWVGPQPR